jgi:hypothetical protein
MQGGKQHDDIVQSSSNGSIYTENDPMGRDE